MCPHAFGPAGRLIYYWNPYMIKMDAPAVIKTVPKH